MTVTRWGRPAPRDPAMARDVATVVSIAPDDRGGAIPNEIPAVAPSSTVLEPTIDAVRAWFAQRDAMREQVATELSAAKARCAELELLLFEIDSLKGQ